MRPLHSFTVRHCGIRLKVRVLATAEEMVEAYLRAPGAGNITSPDEEPRSFFCAIRSAKSRYTGFIVLLACPKLYEYVPHEVTHAVLDYFDEPVSYKDDEEVALSIGILSAKIFKEVIYYAS